MSSTETVRGRAVLSIAHTAGLVDLVSLPIWVGTLIGAYGFSPQQAGGLVTLFLGAVVLSSIVTARRFDRLNGRWAAAGGFAVAAAAFFGQAQTDSFGSMALLQFLGGLGIGVSLSATHGTIGRSANPHRVFAIVNTVLGVFAIAFLGSAPQLIGAFGRETLFLIFVVVMSFAAVVTAIGFPTAAIAVQRQAAGATPARLSAGVWFGIVGVATMNMTQSMIFSFVERIGVDRGFGPDRVVATLVAVGIVNMCPAVLAALLQRRLPAARVVVAGPVLQAALALTITQATTFPPFAVATSVFVFVMLFTHTFAFGLLAQMDRSGRAVAATPAMLMTGSAIGPVLGGVLVQNLGYPSLGFAGLAIAGVGVACFLSVARDASAAHAPLPRAADRLAG